MSKGKAIIVLIVIIYCLVSMITDAFGSHETKRSSSYSSYTDSNRSYSSSVSKTGYKSTPTRTPTKAPTKAPAQTSSAKNKKSSSSKTVGDIYGAEKYSNPDDFADDWEDDFDSWEDAYDYWEDECD